MRWFLTLIVALAAGFAGAALWDVTGLGGGATRDYLLAHPEVLPEAMDVLQRREQMARIEPLPVESDAPARVVINERTGTVVVGANVTLGAAAVAHGSLSVKISTRFDVSQPNAFAPNRAETVVVPNEQVDVREQEARLVALDEGVTLDAVVRALNSLGVTPRDIIAIVQALKAAGSLRAEIVII